MMQGWNMPVLKEDLQVEVDKLVEELGFSGREEFINEAVESRVLELKKKKFIERSDWIGEKLKSKGLSKKDILEDFEEKRHH